MHSAAVQATHIAGSLFFDVEVLDWANASEVGRCCDDLIESDSTHVRFISCEVRQFMRRFLMCSNEISGEKKGEFALNSA